MASSINNDTFLEKIYRDLVLEFGQEVVVQCVKELINSDTLYDFTQGKSMVKLKKCFTVDQIDNIKKKSLTFDNVDITCLFKLALNECNLDANDFAISGTLANYLKLIKNERNAISHYSIYLTESIVEQKVKDLKVLYHATLMKLGQIKVSQGSTMAIYQHNADTIVKRLDKLLPITTLQRVHGDLTSRSDSIKLDTEATKARIEDVKLGMDTTLQRVHGDLTSRSDSIKLDTEATKARIEDVKLGVDTTLQRVHGDLTSRSDSIKVDTEATKARIGDVKLDLDNIAGELDVLKVMSDCTKSKMTDVVINTDDSLSKITSIKENTDDIIKDLEKNKSRYEALEILKASQAQLHSKIDNLAAHMQNTSLHQEPSVSAENPTKISAINNGDDSMENVLSQLDASMDSSATLQNILRELAVNIESYQVSDFAGGIHRVINVLNNNPDNINIQYYGLYVIDYMLRNSSPKPNDRALKRSVEIALKALEAHFAVKKILGPARRVLLTCIGPALFPKYKNLTVVIMKILTFHQSPEQQHDREWFLNLLQSMAFDVPTEYMEVMASTGLMQNLLKTIEQRINKGVNDNELTRSWIIIWSLTDSESNSRVFINEKGHELFLKCLMAFPDEGELLRRIMGAIHNVVTRAELRPALRESSIPEAAYELLTSSLDEGRVSFMAAGIIVSFAVDGPEAWTQVYPTRQQALDRLVATVERLDTDIDYKILKNSFASSKAILLNYSTPELQHTALWEIARFTKHDAKKYCPILQEEGFLPILQKIVDSPKTYTKLKQYAKTIIKNIKDMRNR